MSLSPVPLLLDVDTGVDDALALLYAVRQPRLDLRAVGCVAGNASLTDVVRNTLAVLDTAGVSDVPVAAGHATSLLGEPPDGGGFHGADGLLGVQVPRSERATGRLWPGHAVELLLQTVLASDRPAVLCPLGPMTNVAVLLRSHPEVTARLDRVRFMGGSGVGGNVTAAAEFNVCADPEAAAVVLGSEVRLDMYGLEVFEQVAVDREQVRRLLGAEHPAARLAGRLLETVMTTRGTSTACLGDAGAVASLCLPDAVAFVPRRVVVDTGYGPGRGQTIVDRRPDAPSEAPLVAVAEQVDAAALAEHIVQVLISGENDANRVVP